MSSEGPCHLRESLQPVSTSSTTAHLYHTELPLLTKDLLSSQGFQRETGDSENLSVPVVLPLLLEIHSLYLWVPGGFRAN